jgi:hypothetical protein
LTPCLGVSPHAAQAGLAHRGVHKRPPRTITVDFHNEATYFRLLHDGKVFVEFVLALKCDGMWTFGGGLRAKREASQEQEASLACALLNRMRELGRPQSYPVS